MHRCYIDETGSTGKDLNSSLQPIFVMAGVLVSDERWRKTAEAIKRIAEKAVGEPLPSSFELHACELLSPAGEGHSKVGSVNVATSLRWICSL